MHQHTVFQFVFRNHNKQGITGIIHECVLACCLLLSSLVNIWWSYCWYKEGILFIAHSV